MTTIVLATLAGLFGVDRCYNGYWMLGVFKGLTFGAIGVWYIVDLILLVVGVYLPSDQSSWGLVV